MPVAINTDYLAKRRTVNPGDGGNQRQPAEEGCETGALGRGTGRTVTSRRLLRRPGLGSGPVSTPTPPSTSRSSARSKVDPARCRTANRPQNGATLDGPDLTPMTWACFYGRLHR